MESTLDPGPDETVTKVDTESLQWLREFMTELNTQDNRITATPYYYMVRSPERVEGVIEDSASGHTWKDEDWDTVEDLFGYIKDRSKEEEADSDLNTLLSDNDLNVNKLSEYDEYDIEKITDLLGLTKCHHRDTHKYKGVFFTEKAILKHLEENKHRYPAGTDTYLDHAFRNPEMKKLFESIGKVVGVPYIKK